MSGIEDNKLLNMDVYRKGFNQIFSMVNQFDKLLVSIKADINEDRIHLLEKQRYDLIPIEDENTFEKRRIIAQFRGGVL